MKKLVCFLSALFVAFSINHSLAQNGLLAEYYDGTNFNRKVATRIDDKIDMYWNNRPPVPGIDPHECSIRWTGQLKAPKTGVYTFSARVDDGIRVWVGGKKVIDRWHLNDVGIFSGEVKMEAGKMYDLKIEYFNALVEGEITLLWELPEAGESWFSDWFSDDKKVVEAEYFYQPKSETEQEWVMNWPTPPTPQTADRTPAEKPRPQPVSQPAAPKKPTPPPAKKPQPVKKVTSIDTIQKYIPENIFFERAKTDILPESFADLDKLAEFLNEQTHLKVQIDGHTDYVGDAYKNVILSQDRADAVAAYLMKKGIEEERITAKGYGGSKPLAKNDGRKYHPENRRVEFVIQ
ncbi:MAG: PA14 domain-containing protein [Bacteroidota bacterium]